MYVVTKSYLEEYIAGKRVIILGGAPAVLLNKGEDVDAYDVVVRLNNYDLTRYHASIGNRTDIYYSYFGSLIAKTPCALRDEGVRLLVSKLPYADFRAHTNGQAREGLAGDWRRFFHGRCRPILDAFPVYLPSLREFTETFRILNRVLTTGVHAILTILRARPRILHVTGFDLFASNTHEIDAKWTKGDGSHDIEGERRLLSFFAYREGKRLSYDRTLRRAIGLDTYFTREGETFFPCVDVRKG